MNSTLPWLVLLAPLLSAAVITLFTQRSRSVSAAISVVAVIVSFLGACIIFARGDTAAVGLNWLTIAGLLNVPLGFVLDWLSRMMLVLVSGVGGLIHIYSLGYMRD